jgi:hypothetical protein
MEPSAKPQCFQELQSHVFGLALDSMGHNEAGHDKMPKSVQKGENNRRIGVKASRILSYSEGCREILSFRQFDKLEVLQLLLGATNNARPTQP